MALLNFQGFPLKMGKAGRSNSGRSEGKKTGEKRKDYCGGENSKKGKTNLQLSGRHAPKTG